MENKSIGDDIEWIAPEEIKCKEFIFYNLDKLKVCETDGYKKNPETQEIDIPNDTSGSFERMMSYLSANSVPVEQLRKDAKRKKIWNKK